MFLLSKKHSFRTRENGMIKLWGMIEVICSQDFEGEKYMLLFLHIKNLLIHK